MNLWEIHPVLVHFPLAFLLGGVALDLCAMLRPREGLSRSAAGLMIGGVVLGWLAAAAGVVAFFTAPHSDEFHHLMYWHPAFALAALAIFTPLAIVGWRRRATPARPLPTLLNVVAAVLLIVAGWIGGYMVYQGGIGVSAEQRTAPGGHEHHQH